MSVMSIFILVVALLVALAAAEKSVLVNIQSGPKVGPVGVFYPANLIEDHDHWSSNRPNLLIKVLDNDRIAEEVKAGSSLLFETSDFRARILVEFFENTDAEEAALRPYALKFYNLGLIRDDHAPVELQHGSSGYVWLDAGNIFEQVTDIVHPFTFRDGNGNEIITISLEHAQTDEL